MMNCVGSLGENDGLESRCDFEAGFQNVIVCLQKLKVGKYGFIVNLVH